MVVSHHESSAIQPVRALLQDGAGGGNRTPDPLITNQLLYLLSYAST